MIVVAVAMVASAVIVRVGVPVVVVVAVVAVDVLAVGVLSDEENTVVDIITIALEFGLTPSCSVDAPSDAVVDFCKNALMLDVLSGILIPVLADVNANAFPVATTGLGCPA